MLHSRFIRRELTRSGRQAGVLVLCVALSVVTLVAVDGLGRNIHRALLRDARSLHAADVVIKSNYPFSPELLAAAERLEGEGKARAARYWRFYSMVRPAGADESLLSELKVVEPGYPFYGTVELASGEPFEKTLRPGTAIAEQRLLDRLGLSVGDRIRVGEAILILADVVTREPDRPVSFLSFGPRLFVSHADRDAIELIETGSRVRHRLLLKALPGTAAEALAEELGAHVIVGQERVETYRTAGSRVGRFFDNFLFFLALIGAFTLLLAGVGIHSALTALLREKVETVAVIRTLGASGGFVTGNLLVVVALLGLAGTVLGLALGLAFQFLLPVLFGPLLPPEMTLTVSPLSVLEGLLLGIVAAGLFAFLPLYRLREIKPSAVFRKEMPAHARGVPFYLAVAAILLLFAGAVIWQLRDVGIGLWFVLGTVVLALVTAGLAALALAGLRRLRPRNLRLRQAVRGLFRPGNATLAVTVTLAAATAVLFALYLTEQNLNAA
ncbi:MAG: ABC transporter permease, partial [Thermodesulfobacteriota bacterium]